MSSSYLNLSKKEEERAIELHSKSIVVNGADTTGMDNLADFDERHVSERRAAGITSAIWLLSGGKNAAGSPVYSEFHSTLRAIVESRRRLEETGCLLALTADDIEEAKRSQRPSLMLQLQDLGVVGEMLEDLRLFYYLGTRSAQLVHYRSNIMGDGVGDKKDAGLTKYGAEAVAEMNRLGMLIDLCHVGRVGVFEAVALSKQPPVFTHVAANPGTQRIRGRPDDEMKAIAEKGGVVGAIAIAWALRNPPYVEGNPQATVLDYLDQVDRLVDMVGIDHVGLGLDAWNLSHYPADKYPLGLGRHAEILNVTKGLVSRGYSDGDVRKFLGLNWMRVFRDVLKG